MVGGPADKIKNQNSSMLKWYDRLRA